MFNRIVKSIFGDPMERAVSKYQPAVEKINALESEIKVLSDEELVAKTDEFRQRLANGSTLADILVEAFAVVREVSKRTLGLRHHDVQLIGGMVLHEGRIAEMKTGEGKTLVATLPMYLNALTGKGVHLVTPNDYLSKVGLQQMGAVYHFLGLTASVIQNTGGKPDSGSFQYDPDFDSADDRYQNLRPISRRDAYHTDITYGTNNEFGFDYLRDNMAVTQDRLSQRELHYAIVDEIDNILIDEARTPLIISGPADEPSDYYAKFAQVVKKLKVSSEESVEAEEPDGDYIVDIKDRVSYLTDKGVERVEQIVGVEQLYHPDNSEMLPYLDNSLRAMALYHRDRDYVVDAGEVVIVDDFTGRLMPGRRFSEGLHQAIEAKEGVQIRRENVTMATITFQNYFRMYDKLSGMTGTAATEAPEFENIYKTDVVVIPTNVPVTRIDNDDFIYMNENAKWKAVIEQIKYRSQNNQPVLIGTVAIETSETLSKRLKRAGVEHEVLNAKQHFREAEIITQAGRPGAVTLATNMAGRGVDIKLGGNAEGLARATLRQKGIDLAEVTNEQWEKALKEATEQVKIDRETVIKAGGLYVLGTERHDARRIDNQLRGRSGRQGEPGETRFYLSLEDDLMKRFNADAVKKFMSWANLPEDEPIEHGMISKSIEQAQVRVEGHNFDIRKKVLEYDDVVNRQREQIYSQRKAWLFDEPEEVKQKYLEMIEEQIRDIIDYSDEGSETSTEWDDVDLLYRDLLSIFPVPETINPDTMASMTHQELETALIEAARQAIAAKEAELEAAKEGLMDYAMRFTMLRTIDYHWQRHLTALDMLREGIGLMGIGGTDPLVAYKIEGSKMFRELQDQINEQASNQIFRVQPQVANTPVRRQMRASLRSLAGVAQTQSKPEPVKKKRDIGRNEPCWCGSGKKYKHCHYKTDKQGQTA
ncbi:MAG: preprotein translocase subunit SecA [Anaerolineae bacterium]|nr:preprotein translocase subunit SecA [Anaerolineae bacterium]MDQ7034973.1 preprotein translocase subunit SecA [Anaerolineae bacterium]